jgi:ATP-binding cassette subfamily C (CFTR/MRP) protein 1
VLSDAGKTVLIAFTEASASLDTATDAKIQAALRTAFDSTLIIIAHRLRCAPLSFCIPIKQTARSTVIDLDYILVLSDGQIVEAGPPQELLQIENGHFKRMAGEESIEKTRLD